MILIIDIGDLDLKDNRVTGNYVSFSGRQVILDGTFHVIGRFEVLGTDENGDANVIRDLPPDWRPEDIMPLTDPTVPPEGP